MLIVLEGLDGAGKSTQLNRLADHLTSQGRRVSRLHFPRYEAPVFGAMISAYLRGEFGSIGSVHPQIVALLFAEDRRAALPLLKELSGGGNCLLLDRYVYSNIAFQCAKAAPEEAGALRQWILDVEFGQFGLPRPDLNLFLDVPLLFVGEKLSSLREGSDRDYLAGKGDIHEQDLSFQQAVRRHYLAECGADPSFHRIDCAAVTGEMLPEEAIFERIRSLTDSLL